MAIDTSVPNQRFTTDCEVCCRPFEVTAECEPGEILSLGRVGKLRQPARMNNFDVKVLWIYIVLLLVGGLIGFLKAKSKVSLITSAVFAALLILTTLRGVFQPGFALGLANIRWSCCCWCSRRGWPGRKNSCRAD